MPEGRVVIVGGGIAGLAAAHALSTSPDGARLHITLIEAADRLGGKIVTERVDGLTIEGGPDSFLAAKPAALRLCEAVGIADRVIGTRESGGGTYILRAGRLEPLPEGITMLVPTRLRPLLRSRLLSPAGKLRMGFDLLIPPRRDEADESVAAFVRRRLGREAFERMAQPLLSGIFAGDADQLSLLATFPRLRETELRHGSLVRGMLAQRRQAPKQPASPGRSGFLSLRCGMGELIEALVARLDGVEVRTGTWAKAIEATPEGGYRLEVTDDLTRFDAEMLESDVLILATPAYITADLLAASDSPLAAELRGIPYVSTATVTLAYRRADVERLGAGRGFVIPRIEGRELTAITWASNKFAGRAPDDLALVRGFVGRAGREDVVDLPDSELLALVRRELREITGLAAEPVLARIFRFPGALPQYVVGHLDRLARIDRLLAAHPKLSLAGAAYRGVGIPDCIQSGQAAAAAALGALGSPSPLKAAR